MAARGRALHRHQGRLQRGRLRRLHRGDRRTGRGRRGQRGRRAAAVHRQFLHPVLADAARQGAVHGRRPEAAVRPCARPVAARKALRAMPAPGAAGAGGLPRLAVRLLHPGLRDVAVVDLRAPSGERLAADAPAAGRRPVGQPVPLHRLSADPRCRPAHVRPAQGAARHAARGAGPRQPEARADLHLHRAAARAHRFVPRAQDAGRARRAARGQAQGAGAGRLDRRRPVGQQDVPRPRRHHLRGRRRRDEAHRGARPGRQGRALHRRRCLARERPMPRWRAACPA